MGQRTVYAYTEGVLEPLDREYFKNTLRFLPGVISVGQISKPAVPPPQRATLGYEVRFDDTKLNAAEIEKRLRERGFKVAAIQELAGAQETALAPEPPVPDIYTPAAPNGVHEVLFRVAGLVTVNEVRRIRETLRGITGINDFYSMVAEAADEPWAGDVGLVDVQFDPLRLQPEAIQSLIERVPGLQVTGWKYLPGNLNFPFPN